MNAAPLGLTLTADGAEYAVRADNAERVLFCVYDVTGAKENARIALRRDADGVHRATIPGLKAQARYGLRVEGPFEPWRGHRFDPSKLIADPYAAEIDRPFALAQEFFEFGADSGVKAPKAIAHWQTSAEPGRLRVPWPDTILYELNINGFSRLNEAIPPDQRGRFAALAHPANIAHFQALGVTTIELMPADAWVDERHLPPLGLTNAWGYNPVVFGCPDPRLAPGGWAEIRRATDALHAAGLEVVLDVVLNHDGESDQFGPTLSLRGLDNALYFRLLPNDPERYINDMGCGNCLALDREAVADMALAALKRWMIYGGIDGFRFDLATALGRSDSGFDPHAVFFARMADDAILGAAKLIAEPWDIGPGGYQVGRFPRAFGEWNDRFRDTARRFWRGDRGARGDLATRIAGSHDIFTGDAPASKSINFVVAHDGFTLADLVSYVGKHNEANGEENHDGANENYSWNHGVEGPTDEAAIRRARERDMRNLLALLMLSRGAPMLAMGSEIGHSQRGNNNAYAQNNAISWIDWKRRSPDLTTFIGQLAALRRQYPGLRPLGWLDGARLGDFADVDWRDASGPLDSGARWESEPADVLVAVFSTQGHESVERVALALNRGDAPAELNLPSPQDGYGWRLRLDTSNPRVTDVATELATSVVIAGRATLVLAEAPLAAKGARAPDRADIDALATEAGIAADWWEVSGRHTIVSPHTKLALLDAMRLPARTQAQARESLGALIEATRARRVPPSLTLPLDRPLAVPLRAALDEPGRAVDFVVRREDGGTVQGKTWLGEGARRELPGGRTVIEGRLDLPDLPIGRHRLEIAGASSILTIAPPEAFGARAVWRRRFGVSAQLYALRRERGDEGIGDFTTLGLAGAAAAASGAAYLGVSPLHALFPREPGRASPYHPSDRRFLNPLLIDVLGADGPPIGPNLAARFADEFAALARLRAVDYELVSKAKFAALRVRYAAFEAARLAQRSDPLFEDYARFVAQGGESLDKFALFEAVAAARNGEYWRHWPQPLRDADQAALDEARGRYADDYGFALYCQWLADRQLGAAAAQARAAGLEIGFYRDLAVGSAPDGAESWSRAAELMQGVTVGAPPDPFSAQGQLWHLPALDPVANSQSGWAGLAELADANMRHAGMLRIDHAMGLTRLFVVPDGAKPVDGAYVRYPVDDLIGQIALQSQRERCMVIGEDLGTVPDGFREKLTRAHILGMRVLWFERDGATPRDPAEYPVLSVACASTHDLPTLSGWWRGADIGERLMLGRFTLADAERDARARTDEKRVLLGALRRSGALDDAIVDYDADITDELAAAFHAYIANSGSELASAQFDDLAGEPIATNLPGTDRERPNWRLRLLPDVEALFGSERAKAILAAMARVRK